jgi:hypothetical protein
VLELANQVIKWNNFGFSIREKHMKKIFRIRVFHSRSDNVKSKIQNGKSAGRGLLRDFCLKNDLTFFLCDLGASAVKNSGDISCAHTGFPEKLSCPNRFGATVANITAWPWARPPTRDCLIRGWDRTRLVLELKAMVSKFPTNSYSECLLIQTLWNICSLNFKHLRWHMDCHKRGWLQCGDRLALSRGWP